jgi:hypothetical protein
MIHDVIERFRYRFELWRREQGDEYFRTPSSGPSEEPDYLSRFSGKREELLRESTVKSIGRLAGAYAGIIVIAAQICLFIAPFIPSARFTLAVIFLVFAGLWTLVTIVFEIDLRKARKQYRQMVTKSSNQPMQLTADRCDDQITIHDPPYTPSFPRFRQR